MIRNTKARKIAQEAQERDFVRRGERLDKVMMGVAIALLFAAFWVWAASLR
jgi:hypothetical protein